MSAMDQLLEVMARLRDPENGCPWDVEQTFATIAPYTIEEAYEVADAISDEDWPALLDELGDLALEVGPQPRHGGELQLVGGLVQADPQPEVRGVDAQLLLGRHDVGGDEEQPSAGARPGRCPAADNRYR